MNELRRFPDAKTGREVWQLTSDPGGSEAVYFEAQAFTADERFVIFRSQRGGRSGIWRCELPGGELRPLAEGLAISGHSLGMHPDGRHAWTVADDGALWRVDVLDDRAEEIWRNRGEVPGKLKSFAAIFSRDGNRCALATSEGMTQEPIPDALGEARCEPSHLIFFDCSAKKVVSSLRVPEGFSHPLINPGHPDLASLVRHGNRCWRMDLPQEKRVRTWLADARDGSLRPLITPLRGRTVTHESWAPDGERMWFFDKNAGEWLPVSICSVARDGSDWRCHFTSYHHRLGHGRLDATGRVFISDCQQRHDSPLLQIDAASGAHQVLCWPDSSNDGGHDACAHVHPSISPSGRFACYTSDRSGAPQVHLVPLDQR